MSELKHREFQISNDCKYVAVGSVDGDVCVIRLSDGHRFDLKSVSYDFGGERLAVDGIAGWLFAGAYYYTGIAAYEFETSNQVWTRRDLKKLQKIAYDSRDELVYCAFEDRATRPLNARDGREKRPLRGLQDFYFSPDGQIALFAFDEVRLENRSMGTTHFVPRETRGILSVAFSPESAVIAWVGGPVASYSTTSGERIWNYAPDGVHAYDIAPAQGGSDVWIVEQPFKEPPWYRLRRMTESGSIVQEIRCGLGHSFKILPHLDKVIRADLSIQEIDKLGADY